MIADSTTPGVEGPPEVLAALLSGLACQGAPAALQALALAARSGLLTVLMLGRQEAATARELAEVHAAIALQGVRQGRPPAPTLMLSAGPVVAPNPGDAAGHFLLALALALDHHPAVHAAAAGMPATGAAATALTLAPDTLERAARQGLDLRATVRAVQTPGSGEPAADFLRALGWHRQLPALALEGDVLRAVLLW